MTDNVPPIAALGVGHTAPATLQRRAKILGSRAGVILRTKFGDFPMCSVDTGLVHGPLTSWHTFRRTGSSAVDFQHGSPVYAAPGMRARILAAGRSTYEPPTPREHSRCVVVPANVERCMWEV